MTKKAQIAFTGEVHKAQCQCHKGQWLVVIFMIHPYQGRIYLHNVAFKTEAEAEAELQSCVELAAMEVMTTAGLKKDLVKKVEVSHGDDAIKSESKFMNEHNPILH